LFGGVSTIAPSLARRLARRLFFAPGTTRQRPEDLQRLASAEAFTLEGRFGSVAGWAWGAGPVVLLVHGWGGYAGQMTSLVEPLRAAGYRVVAMDMPAHGRSQGKVTSVIHFEDAMARLANREGPLHGVLAHSFGAAATTLALSRGLQVGRVVSLSPPADFVSFFYRFRVALGVRENIWQGMIRDAQAWLGGISFEELEPTRLAPALTTPLLVVHDQDDREIAFDEAARLVRAWPGARLHPTKGLGHFRILRDPDVAALAVRFLLVESSPPAQT